MKSGTFLRQGFGYITALSKLIIKVLCIGFVLLIADLPCPYFIIIIENSLDRKYFLTFIALVHCFQIYQGAFKKNIYS